MATTTPYNSALCWLVTQTGQRRLLAPPGPHKPTIYAPHKVSATSTYSCSAFGRVSAGHDSSDVRCAAATPSNIPATMASSIRGAHLGPLCSHARVPAQKGDAVFPGRPSHTRRPRMRLTAFRVHGLVARHTHRATLRYCRRSRRNPARCGSHILAHPGDPSTGSVCDFGLIRYPSWNSWFATRLVTRATS